MWDGGKLQWGEVGDSESGISPSRKRLKLDFLGFIIHASTQGNNPRGRWIILDGSWPDQNSLYRSGVRHWKYEESDIRGWIPCCRQGFGSVAFPPHRLGHLANLLDHMIYVHRHITPSFLA